MGHQRHSGGYIARRLTAGGATASRIPAHTAGIRGARVPIGFRTKVQVTTMKASSRDLAPQMYRHAAGSLAQHESLAGQQSSWQQSLQRAALLVERDPDAAALLLDGALYGLASAWFVCAERAIPAREHLLPELELAAPSVCWRLRLALRAPDVRARLVHARALLAVVFGENDFTKHTSQMHASPPTLQKHCVAIE